MSTATQRVGPPLLPKYISRYMATGEQATGATGHRRRKPVHKSPVNRQPFQIINVPPNYVLQDVPSTGTFPKR